MGHGHVLLLTLPAQGHLNPSIQFAKRLTKMGMHVTFLTTSYAQSCITDKSFPFIFASFSDGYDKGFNLGDADPEKYAAEFRNRSSQALRDTIISSADEGCPVTCLVHTLFLPWAAEVARDHHIPSALLWIQPATVLGIYYYYFHGYKEVISTNINDPSYSIKLPNLPLSLASRDLPNFLLPENLEVPAYKFALPSLKTEFEALDEVTNPKILLNTFEELESEALKAIEGYKLIAVGPLLPSVFLDGKDPKDLSFGADLFKKSIEYVDWLDSKAESSVVYVSFGSMLELPKKQMEEIALGLIECGRPFLWVIRENSKKSEVKEVYDLSGYREKLEETGLIVPWCSQLEVLSHPSLGCFVTHCGWNSTLESLASGVPTVAFPQWTDQTTNAKLVEDVWETGVRVRDNGEGIVEWAEVKRCIEMVMGEEGLMRRENAKKLKDLARKAVEDGGSSDINLRAFVDEIAG